MSAILTEKDRFGIAKLTFNRPEKGNAFNPDMLEIMAGFFDEVRDDPAVRVVLIRAVGRHFCTGADVSSSSRGGSGPTLKSVLDRLETLPKPVVGIVQGACVGGGLGFVACCDVAIALEDSYFMVPELRVGIAPSRSFSGLLARAFGVRALRYYGLSGAKMPAREALRLGLVHDVAGADEIESRLEAVLDLFFRCAPQALAEFKRALAQYEMSPGDFLRPGEGQVSAGLERSPEAVEGLAAFREKRMPSWYVAR